MTTTENGKNRQKLPHAKRFMHRAVQAVAPDRIKPIYNQSLDNVDYMNWGEAKVECYADAYDCKPPPFIIPLITIAELAVFAYYAVLLNSDNDLTNDVTATSGVPIGSPLIYSPYRRVEVWRFIGYMFLHQGYIHIIFNCIIQLILGTLLELVHKFWRVLIVYLLGVLAGSMTHSCFDTTTYLVGASGGCYALIGAHFATVLMNWDTMQKDWCANPINVISSGVFRLIFIFLLAGADTGMAVYYRFASDIPNQAGFSAHFGGLIAGVLVGVPVLRNLEVRPWEKVCFWVCIALYCVIMIGGITFNCLCAPVKCYATDFTKP